MKIERLRKSHKKEIIIGVVLTVVIGGALTFKLTHSKYRVTQSIDLATGVIKYQAPDFQIIAMQKSEDGINYSEITTMPSSGYVINTSKSYCNLNGTKDNNVVIENVNGKPLFSGLNKGDKCFLYFDKEKTGGDYILANITLKSGTPTFSQVAKTDQGVYSTTDGMYEGTTYYWRGAVTNNYVQFANYCWRIIRINGDKTLRLIYDGSKCHANGTNTLESIAVTGQRYNPSYNQSYYVGWTQNGTQRTNSTTATESNAKVQTESWYKTNITEKGFDSKVADGKYCNDRNVDVPPSSFGWSTTYTTTWNTNTKTENRNRFAYAGAKRLYESYNPTFSCPSGDVYILKVGAITADEVEFAGGKSENNASYYLYNGQAYWTMSPASWDGGFTYVFFVNTGGNFNHTITGTIDIGLRPVINLKSDVIFSSGNGTQSNPYIVAN